MKNLQKIGIIAIATAILGTQIIGLNGKTYKAEDNAINLSPIQSETSDCVYEYLTSPTAIYADMNGVFVTDGKNVIKATQDQSSAKVDINVAQLNQVTQKAIPYNDCTVTLCNGVLNVNYGNATISWSEHVVTDFTIYNETLYAIGDDGLSIIPITTTDDGYAFDTDTATTLTLISNEHTSTVPQAITVLNENKIYVAIKSSALPNKHDIVSVTPQTGVIKTAYMQTDEILALTAMPSTGLVYALTRDSITAYAPTQNVDGTTSDGLSRKYYTHDKRMIDVCAYNGSIYALDTLNGVHKISTDLTTFKTLFASASNEKGFFNLPFGATVKNSQLFVADTLNDRIAIYGDDVTYYTQNDIPNPIAITCDSRGTTYVAYDYNKVCTISTSTKSNQVLTIDGSILDIVVDYEKNLFILSDCGLFVKPVNGELTQISSTPYKAITLAVSNNRLFALDTNQVSEIKHNGDAYTAVKHCDATSNDFSIAADIKGNVFLLSRSAVTRYDKISQTYTTFTLNLDRKPYDTGFTRGQILISTVENDFIDYNDVIIVDTYKHRLFKVDGSSNGLNAVLVNDDYVVPDVDTDATPSFKNDGLIRVALYDVALFDKPMETVPLYTIAKDRKVIVAEYDLDDTKEYALVLIDDISQGKLLKGYVYKDALSEPLSYSPPPTQSGTIYTDATPVFKWPSKNSQPLNSSYDGANYSALNRGYSLTLLDFVASYYDDYGSLWYRVEVPTQSGKMQGFILGDTLSLLNYDPVFIHPAYNAEIISYNGSEYAVAYELIDGEYVQLDATLPTGAKVEVIGIFDTSEQYTQIKYFNAELGTLTCYVKTEYLKYNGVNFIQIIAIVVIVITVILATIIIIRVFHLKKKRLLNLSEEERQA